MGFNMKNIKYVSNSETDTKNLAKKLASQLSVGDIIISADGEDVDNLAYLRYLLYTHDVGDTMELTIYRNGDEVNLTVTLNQAAS